MSGLGNPDPNPNPGHSPAYFQPSTTDYLECVFYLLIGGQIRDSWKSSRAAAFEDLGSHL